MGKCTWIAGALLFFLELSLAAGEVPCDTARRLSLKFPGMDRVLGSDEWPECQPIQPGAFSDIKISNGKSPTEVLHRYRLQRTPEGDYKVIFNVMFYPDISRRQMVVDNELTKKWRATAANCFREVNARSKGPNGEKLTFEIYEGPEGESAPPLNNIGMRKSGRAHSGSWTEDMKCSVVVHELLHLAGLVDEYSEDSHGYVKNTETGRWEFVETKPEKTAYNFRKTYSKNSIMASDGLAWSEFFSNWTLRTDFCSCDQSDGCKKFFDDQMARMKEFGPGMLDISKPPSKALKVAYPSSCPSGFKKSGRYLDIPLPDDIKKMYDDGLPMGGAIPEGFTPEELQKIVPIFNMNKRSATQERNILELRHFNSIVYPGCISKNHAYYQSALNAYRTSIDHGGEGCIDYGWIKK